jgi:hypothetical protein
MSHVVSNIESVSDDDFPNLQASMMVLTKRVGDSPESQIPSLEVRSFQRCIQHSVSYHNLTHEPIL